VTRKFKTLASIATLVALAACSSSPVAGEKPDANLLEAGTTFGGSDASSTGAIAITSSNRCGSTDLTVGAAHCTHDLIGLKSVL